MKRNNLMTRPTLAKNLELKGAIIGITISVIYTLITLLLFPIGDCATNTLCGLAFEFFNLHTYPFSVLEIIPYNPPWSVFAESVLVGLVLGAVIGRVYSKVRSK